MHRFLILGTLAALAGCILFSCSEERVESIVTESSKPVMREVSELVLLMFKMESELKTVRARLEEDSIHTPLSADGFDKIYTAQASKDIQKDSVFISKADIYLGHLEKLSGPLKKDSALVYFNNAVGTCVSCHQDYCPGPVARIKKLRIK